MSKDGYLPDDVTEDMIPGNRPGDDHDEACPHHQDYDHAECCDGENVGAKHDCACADLAEEAEARAYDAAEQRAQERRDGI